MEKNKIFVSSSCFKTRKLEDIIDICERNEILNLEISGNIKYIPLTKLIDIFQKYKHFNFRFHNYFPIPRVPFVINLAHPAVVKKSLNNISKGINLSKDYGGDIFSIHSGFLINPKENSLGQIQSHYKDITLNEALNNLENSFIKLSKLKNNTILCIENNVVEKYNLNQKKNRYIFSDLSDKEFINKLITKFEIRVLLDLAHLKVSSKTLGFNSSEFIDEYMEKTKIIHLSENNGLVDQNLPLKKNSWFWNKINWKSLDYVSLGLKTVL